MNIFNLFLLQITLFRKLNKELLFRSLIKAKKWNSVKARLEVLNSKNNIIKMFYLQNKLCAFVYVISFYVFKIK